MPEGAPGRFTRTINHTLLGKGHRIIAPINFVVFRGLTLQRGEFQAILSVKAIQPLHRALTEKAVSIKKDNQFLFHDGSLPLTLEKLKIQVDGRT